MAVGSVRPPTRDKGSKGFTKDIVVVLFIIAPVIFLIVSAPRVIKVNQIICKDQWGSCPQAISDQLGKISGSSLHQTKSQIGEFLYKDFSVERYSVRFIIPDRIRLDLIMKKPLFALEVGQELALIDKSGFVVGHVGETNLPRLKYDKKVALGDIVPPDALFGLELLLYMREIYQTYEGELTSESIIFKLKDGTKLVFPKNGDPRVLVGASSVVISELNKLGDESRMELSGLQSGTCSAACTIDLRYVNPVITRGN